MALFTDGPISTTLDLQNYESGILNVAHAEGIDIAAKIVLAQDDIANQLLMFLLRRLPVQDLQSTLRRTRGVTDVVVTAPLRQWHAHKTLALAYRDAYNNQLNDRYLGKSVEYDRLAKSSAQNYLQVGVGLVADPIPKAAAPMVTTVAGTAPAAAYYVSTTWVNRAGDEGSPSDPVQGNTDDGEQLFIAAANPPANALGWNAYIGTSPDSISLQNDAPIGTGTTWLLAAALRAGIQPGEGQQPTWFLVDHRVIERG